MIQNHLQQVQEEDENEIDESQIKNKSFVEEEKKVDQSDILVTVPLEFVNSGIVTKIKTLEQVNGEIDGLRVKIKEWLLQDTNLMIIKSFQSFLEDFIVLMLWTSTIFKLNVQSMLDFSIVILFYFNKTPGMIFKIMNVMNIIFFARLLIILSNINQQLNPMKYPSDHLTRERHS